MTRQEKGVSGPIVYYATQRKAKALKRGWHFHPPMAKLRKFCAYRRLERPYTRTSKYRNKSFVRNRPNSKVVRYTMGNKKKDYPYSVKLFARENVQVRHNAIEAARQTANRAMESGAGKGNFMFHIRIFPHHILRENPLASGAGADRMSTGMKKSFGKAIGVAAQVETGQVIAEIHVDKQHVKSARRALSRFTHKLPCTTRLQTYRGDQLAESI